MSPERETVEEGAARLERIIERAIEAGQSVRAAEAGIVLGALLTRSGTGGPRIRRATEAVVLAGELDGPLAIRDAWQGPGTG